MTPVRAEKDWPLREKVAPSDAFGTSSEAAGMLQACNPARYWRRSSDAQADAQEAHHQAR